MKRMGKKPCVCADITGIKRHTLPGCITLAMIIVREKTHQWNSNNNNSIYR